MLAAQQATAGGAPAAAWRDKAEPVLLGVLLGGQPWPTGWGLWITAPGMSTVSAADPAVGPCTWSGRAFGAVVELPRFPLQLLLGSPGQPEAVYQPGGLIVRDERATAHQVLALGWPGDPGGPPVISIRLRSAAQEQWP